MSLRDYVVRAAIIGAIGYGVCELPHSCTGQTVPCEVARESPLEEVVAQAVVVIQEKQ